MPTLILAFTRITHRHPDDLALGAVVGEVLHQPGDVFIRRQRLALEKPVADALADLRFRVGRRRFCVLCSGRYGTQCDSKAHKGGDEYFHHFLLPEIWFGREPSGAGLTVQPW